MFCLPAYLLAIACIFISTTHGQFDYGLCPDGPTSNTQDPKWRPVPPRFEIVTELVSESEVWELSQAFSTTRDAIISSTTRGPIQFYYSFATSELFQVLTAVIGQQEVLKCFREPITDQSETSVITPKTLFVKPSILLGYDPRNQQNTAWGVHYDGDGKLRGIPTNRFKSCFLVSDTQATVSATYHVSDPTKFQAYLPANESIPLQIEVTTTSPRGGRESFVYNIFHYSPNPRQFEERQALETPAGVYCPNRTPTLPVPTNIPESSSANTEMFIPNFNSSILSSKNFFDTNFQFTLFDVWYADPAGGPLWFHLTEVHDFAVGLSYQFNHSNYRCAVRDLNTGGNEAVSVDGNPSLLQLGNPQHIFLLDDMEYQYTGEKRCRDRVSCHVWIGEKSLGNDTVEHREWYWATRVNGEVLTDWIPSKLVIKRYVSEVPVMNIELNIFNFRRRPMTIFEVDYTLANCYRALGPSENYNLAVLSFTIDNEKKYPVMQNINFLRLHIWETLIFSMFVRPIRISHLNVDHRDTGILVTFTLLDAPPRTGPVENPLKESSLDNVIDRLSSIIDASGLAFRARYDTKQVVLRARVGSLNVNHRSSKTKVKTSGSKITGLWVGFVVAGLVVGVVGGFLVFQKLANK
ncbi:unnamed protein product [Rotaria socialis]